ncbi:hypothetical protein [Lysobacter capsici]|uniref:hypothetical protein n=1 Tax=Lysobacter capsici TaxID=435897 RepID=UPI0012FD3AE9|nr:hypothetical protein [Lysobacter capsici]
MATLRDQRRSALSTRLASANRAVACVRSTLAFVVVIACEIRRTSGMGIDFSEHDNARGETAFTKARRHRHRETRR